MKENVSLVIRANDYSTDFLRALYARNLDALVLDENVSNSQIENTIKETKGVVMMLGHGSPSGLFGCFNLDNYYADMFLVSSKNVQSLRKKTCIGIWCHANSFASKYGLTGLFSGMVISEYEEACMLSVQVEREEILAHNHIWIGDLLYCLSKYDLKDVPSAMLDRDKWHTPLTEFNYSSLYYFKNGKIISNTSSPSK